MEQKAIMTRQKQNPNSSRSVQDFLKTVYTLQQMHDRVSTNALAEALAITAPSVTDMAQRLVKEGAIDYRKYKGVRLTDQGESVALKMLRRHRLIELYLVQGLGYELHEVHDEAEALEHTVTDKFVEAIAAKMGHPEFDPHGDPIPHRDGTMPERELIPLSTLPIHKSARISRYMTENPEMLLHTQERGLLMDCSVEVLRRDPFDGPITIRLNDDTEIIIGYLVATSILVELFPE